MSENYYKSAIDRLDAKYRPASSGLQNPVIILRKSEPPRVISPVQNRAYLDGLDDDVDLDYCEQEHKSNFDLIDETSSTFQQEIALLMPSERKLLWIVLSDATEASQNSMRTSTARFVVVSLIYFIRDVENILSFSFLKNEKKQHLRHNILSERRNTYIQKPHPT